VATRPASLHSGAALAGTQARALRYHAATVSCWQIPMSMHRRLTLLLLLAPCALRAEVLLERIGQPGFAEAAYAVGSQCTIDATGQLAQHYRLGGELGSSRVQQLQLTGAALRQKIRAASGGEILEETYPVDAETWIYRAWKPAADGSAVEVLLYEENGGTGQRRINQDRAARMLKNFLDLNCSGALQD